MEQITTIGIDLVKTIFQVHAIDASGKVLLQKAVKRAALLQLLGITGTYTDHPDCLALRSKGGHHPAFGCVSL